MAIASTPWSTIRRMASRAVSSFRATTAWPSKATRSSISAQSHLGTSGSGLVWRATWAM